MYHRNKLRILVPEETYPEVRGIPPVLMVYFGDLNWRAVGSVGMGCVYSPDNDTGPDDANHDHHGIFIGYDPVRPGPGTEREGLNILDIGPTVLDYFGVEVPADWQGKVIEIGIEGADFTRFTILSDGKGTDLFDCLYANVTVEGEISGTNSEGNPTILVENYKIHQRFLLNDEWDADLI